MSEEPRVSVVMPNYNKSRFIGHAIESVIEQTFKDFELIAVDDASTDGSFEVIESWAERDRRIRSVKTEGHKGVAPARNLGVHMAKGEAISFIDSDDVYSRSKLEHQYQTLTSEGRAAVVYCDWWRIDETGARLPQGKKKHPTASGMIFGDILSLGFGVNMMYMVPKSALMKVGLFDTTLPWGEDYDILLKLARLYPFRYLDEKLYGYRNYPGNTRNAFDRETRLRYQIAITEKHLRGSEHLLSLGQKNVIERRLLDDYFKTRQFRKLLKRGLKGSANMRHTLNLILGSSLMPQEE